MLQTGVGRVQSQMSSSCVTLVTIQPLPEGRPTTMPARLSRPGSWGTSAPEGTWPGVVRGSPGVQRQPARGDQPTVPRPARRLAGGRGTHIRRDPDEPETRGTWNTPLVEAGLTRDRGPARPVSSPGPTGLHSVYMTGSKSAHPLLVGFFMSGLAAPRGARHAISQTHADQP